ncbi:hypothetical protein Tsubulata_028538 [Turnera subulata]|uniref:RWP-RK domain-containing protein n=1 Tax=Turnera subulata TaxID=218843 RepID=A0A9Q0J732_9ROSI|nr:hypothetical protein Tsubulata_028538 [Turnera subulata]
MGDPGKKPDPRAMVPYHDPHDTSFDEDFANYVLDSSNPSLANFPHMDQAFSSLFPPPMAGDHFEYGSTSMANSNDQMEDPLGPLYDPALLEMIGHWDDLGIDDDDPPVPPTMQMGGQVPGAMDVGGSSSNGGMPIPPPAWPQGSGQFSGGQNDASDPKGKKPIQEDWPPVGGSGYTPSWGSIPQGYSPYYGGMPNPAWKPLTIREPSSGGGSGGGTSNGGMPYPAWTPPVNFSSQTYGGVNGGGTSNGGMPTPVWPQATSSLAPFSCCNCQVLREIIHTDGQRTSKLHIHGIVGAICHAIMEYVNFGSLIPRYQMIDLSGYTLLDIKQLLQQYCDDRMMAGWAMLTDPLSSYYETLAAGLEWVDYMSSDEISDPSTPNSSGEGQSADPTEGENEVDKDKMPMPPRSHLARQRERTSKMTLRDLDDVFHLTIEQAAKKMGLCTTVIKRICRKHQLKRWPQRKVKSIRRRLAKEKLRMNTGNAKERALAKVEILKLLRELDIVCKRNEKEPPPPPPPSSE